MDGFKNTTKIQYFAGGGRVGPKGAAKISQTMKEFKEGTLHSGSKQGPDVSSRKQAVAIALSQARKAGADIPVKKAGGGLVKLPVDPDYADEGVMRKARSAPAVRPSPPAAPPRSYVEAQAQRSALDKVLSTLPSQRGEMPVGKKCGGLAVMPRKK